MNTTNNENGKLKVEDVVLEDKSEWKKVEPERDPAWQPTKAGDAFIGKYISFRSDVGKNHSQLYTLADPSGKRWVVWGCDVLDKRMEQIRIGSEVKIVYDGEGIGERKRPYHKYEVYSK